MTHKFDWHCQVPIPARSTWRECKPETKAERAACKLRGRETVAVETGAYWFCTDGPASETEPKPLYLVWLPK